MPTSKHMKRQYVHPSPYPVMSLQTSMGYKNTPVRPAKVKVSELYCYYTHLRGMGHICLIAFSSKFPKKLVRYRVELSFGIWYLTDLAITPTPGRSTVAIVWVDSIKTGAPMLTWNAGAFDYIWSYMYLYNFIHEIYFIYQDSRQHDARWYL